MPNPKFKKGGPSPNPHGRPRSRIDGRKVLERTQEALKSMAEFVVDDDSDFSEPVQLLNAFARCPSIPDALRISAAAAAAPYLQPKLLPVPGPQYVYTPIAVPDFESVEQAESFLLDLLQRVGTAQLEIQSANEIFAKTREWIRSRRDGAELEIKQLNADASNAEQVIHIEGGLPTLPGTNIIMPEAHPSTAMPIESVPDILLSADKEPADPAE